MNTVQEGRPLTKGLIIILAALVAFGPLSIDMYLPTLTLIAEDLGASHKVIEQSITFYLFGFSVGMFFYGPLSDRFGRRRLLLLGIAIYCLATVGCFLAETGRELVLWRLLQALGGASASVLARAIVRDLYSVQDSARVLSWMHIITMMATLIAPLLGSFIGELLGWRSIFVFLFLFAALVATVCVFQIPETLPPEARIESIRKVIGSYGVVLKNRRALGYIGCMSMAFGGMFVYITTSPFVYIQHFGVSPFQYALLFALNIFSIMIFTFINTRQVQVKDPQVMIRFGASLVLGAALFMLLANSLSAIPLVLVVLGLFLFVGMTGILSANCIAKLMGLFSRKQAGTAAGLAVAIQFGVGGILSYLASQSEAISPDAMIYFIAAAGALSFLFMLLSRE